MSLISEALKEAQRERTERAGPRAAASIVETVFPYPTNRQSAEPNRALLIGAVAVVVLIGGAGLGWRWYARRTVKAPIVAPLPKLPVAAPVTTPAAPKQSTPSVVEPATKAPSVDKPVTSLARKTGPAASHETAPRTVTPPAAVAVDSAPAKTVAAAPAPAPTVQPQGAASGVRIVLDPNGARPSDSLFAQAYAEHRRGNFDMARDLYEKALRKPPVAPELYNNYGALLASTGNHDAAIVMFNLGLKLNPADARLWSNLATSLNASGRHAEAMSAYAQAAKIDPTNGAVKTRLAAEYVAIGDTSSARRMYDDAVRVAAKDAGVHYDYGVFLQSQRDFKGAIREFQLFVDLAGTSYPAAKVDEIRKHVARLRQANP